MSTGAPEPAPPVQGWVQMKPCPRCGQALDPTKAVYSKQGELLCKSCEAGDLITEGYLRAAKGSCYGAVGTGVLSIFFNPVYIFSVLAIIQGIRALMLINRTEYRAVLGNMYLPLTLAASLGIVGGLVHPRSEEHT